MNVDWVGGGYVRGREGASRWIILDFGNLLGRRDGETRETGRKTVYMHPCTRKGEIGHSTRTRRKVKDAEQGRRTSNVDRRT